MVNIDAFYNKGHSFHMADLFDIESMTHNIFKHESNLSPSLAVSSFSRSIPNLASNQIEMDSSNTFMEDDVHPLYLLLGKLHYLVDDHIHIQHTAGTTKVGYNAYYEHKMAFKNPNSKHATALYWKAVQDQLEY